MSDTGYAASFSADAGFPAAPRKPMFFAGKRVVDLTVGTLLLPVLVLFMLGLLVLNPALNRGPLFYTQRRMGRNCEPFTIYKFRTMKPVDHIARSAQDPLETDRITSLGYFLRRFRADELPQIINVLKGDMSLIGPRPDLFEHASAYLATVPHYRWRHRIRPGISGLSQVKLGYAVGDSDTRHKARIDCYYIDNLSVRMEAWVFLHTLRVVFGLKGT